MYDYILIGFCIFVSVGFICSLFSASNGQDDKWDGKY